MLATLTDYPARITLIQDSGIQFLDFGLPAATVLPELPGAFVRKTANGPLLRLAFDTVHGRYLLANVPGEPPEMVRPELRFPLEYSLHLLNNQWLPLPFLRFNPASGLLAGPDNWARLRITRLEDSDSDGNRWRITLAFDTQVLDAAEAPLAPTDHDVSAGLSFALAHHSRDLDPFLDLTWVDGWLRETFVQQAVALEQRSEAALRNALKLFEYQAHYLNLLAMFGDRLQLPQIRLIAPSAQAPAVAVDLILDVGNSHTCGIMVEDHPEESDGLKHTYELQLRDLAQPQYLYQAQFDSRAEFAPAEFGKAQFSFQSGREQAFCWPSMMRVGSEASRLAARRQGTEGATGLSSPRRYLWDEERYPHGWRFNIPQEPMAAAAPLAHLLNDQGQPLFNLAAEERLPVFSASYSRSAIMTLMLSELLAQVLMQINSVGQRLKMPHGNAPRQLRNIILTLPCAMPKPERELFRRRMHDAIGLVWKAQGWHPVDAPFTSLAQQNAGKLPVPQVQMAWDEATCGQLVYLYNETQLNFAGHSAAFFASMARPDRPAAQHGKALRIASIDIGGGTSDLSITQFSLDDGVGHNVKIVPNLLFREGFKMAGDDILLDVIQQYLLPAVQRALQQAGVAQPAALMDKLFGSQGRLDGFSARRQQTALQLFIPLGHAILQAYEQYDPLDRHTELAATFGELLPQLPTTGVLTFINGETQRQLPADAATFDILQTPLLLPLHQLHVAFLNGKMRIAACLRALAEVVAHYGCDVLLLSGRPCRLPGVQALLRHLQPLPANRIVSLDGYHTSSWYPFHHQGKIENPKSTAAVGAMLCLLALDLRLGSFYFKAGDFQPYSTIRYLGMLDAQQALTADNVYYRDIDLDAAEFMLDAARFPLRGPLQLGFRQLDNDRWPATPLYNLSIVDAQLARRLASNDVLHLRLRVVDGERFELADAVLADGTPVPLQQLQLRLNTLAAGGAGATHYWIDSGSVFNT